MIDFLKTFLSWAHDWQLDFGAAAFVAGIGLAGIGHQRRFRKNAGVLGAFPVRLPLGKLAAFGLAVGMLPAAWSMSERMAGPVAWREKGVYAETLKDSIVDGLRAVLPGRKSVTVYPVLVCGPAGKSFYLNDPLFLAGMPWRWEERAGAAAVHQSLDRFVYGGKFVWMFRPIWMGWTMVALVCFSFGTAFDLRRLREARNTGVHIRGNRQAANAEWDERMAAGQ